jgi:spore germination protein KA
MGSVKQSENWEDILASLMSGNTIIFVDGIDQAIIANTAGGEKRSIEEPITQVSIRGARDGFIE